MNLKRSTHLILLVLLGVFVIYSGWWAFGAYQLKTYAEQELEKLIDGGLHVSERDYELSGFPGNVRWRIANLEITDPIRNWQWLGENLELSAEPWKPDRLVLSFMGKQKTRLPIDGKLVLLNWDTREATLVFEPSIDAYDVRMQMSGAVIQLDTGETILTAEALHIGLNADYELPPGADRIPLNTLDLGGTAIHLPGYGDLPLGNRISQIDSMVSLPHGLPASVTPEALERWIEDEGLVKLERLNFIWSEFRGELTGQLSLDQVHRISGKLDATFADLPRTLMILGEKGVLDKKVSGIAAGAAQIFSPRKNSAGQPIISLPLSFEDGFIYLGPVRLGKLPSLSGKSAKAEGSGHENTQDVPEPGNLGEPPTVSLPQIEKVPD